MRRRSWLREYGEAILIAALFLRFANTFVVQTFYIPSGSMEDTLLIGDHLFVNRFIYGAASALEKKLLPFRDVRRGDIVVFRSKEDPTIDMVKRCVGVPGDEIRVVDKQLFINGHAVDDASYTKHIGSIVYKDVPAYPWQLRRRDNFGPEVVPPGHYFCMGDNRDDSNDSRFWGPLPAHLIKGRAGMIYWSYGGRMADEEQASAAEKLRQLGSTAAGFFTKTRWSRTFQMVR
jgi:signal peptidase I